MRAAAIQFFTRPHKDEEKLQRKIWAFLEKIMIHYFYISTIVSLSKGSSGTKRKCIQYLPPYYNPAEFLRLLFAIKYLMLDFAKCLLAAET